MGRASAALPIPFLGAESADILNLQILAAFLIAGLLAALFLAIRFALARDRGRDALEKAERRVAALRAVLGAAPGSYWSWPVSAPVSAPAQDAGTGGRGIAAVLGTGGVETFDDVVGAFAPRPAGDLRDNVAALRATGTPFTLIVSDTASDAASDTGSARRAAPAPMAKPASIRSGSGISANPRRRR
jgi:hypothetical protein